MKPHMFFSPSRQLWLCYTKRPLRGVWAETAETAYRMWQLLVDENTKIVAQ